MACERCSGAARFTYHSSDPTVLFLCAVFPYIVDINSNPACTAAAAVTGRRQRLGWGCHISRATHAIAFHSTVPSPFSSQQALGPSVAHSCCCFSPPCLSPIPWFTSGSKRRRCRAHNRRHSLSRRPQPPPPPPPLVVRASSLLGRALTRTRQTQMRQKEVEEQILQICKGHPEVGNIPGTTPHCAACSLAALPPPTACPLPPHRLPAPRRRPRPPPADRRACWMPSWRRSWTAPSRWTVGPWPSTPCCPPTSCKSWSTPPRRGRRAVPRPTLGHTPRALRFRRLETVSAQQADRAVRPGSEGPARPGPWGGGGGGGGLLYWARSCCSCCCCCCCCCLQRHTDRCAAPLVRCSDAARFKGLAAEDMLVYQCIQSAGSMGAGRGWWGAGRGAGGCSPAAAARLAGWIACVTLPAQAVRRALAGCLPACLAASADAAAAGVPCPPPRTAAEELLQASGRGT